nr:two-component regulator propeller domain-containing protein [Allomuricauda sp.]
MKKYIVHILLVFASIAGNAQEYKYKVKQFNIGEGLAHTDATSFAQDSNGFIWIGTFGGLNKFDGYNFELFRNSQSNLSSAFTNRIMGLAHSDGLLFMATQGGLVCFRSDTETFVTIDYSTLFNDEVKNSRVNFVFAKNQKLFAITANGLYVFEYRMEKGRLVLNELEVLGDEMVSPVFSCFLRENTLWVTTTHDIYKMALNEEPSHYLSKVSVTNQLGETLSATNCVFVDKDNKLWVGGINQLHLIDLYELDNGEVTAHTFQNFESVAKKGFGISKMTDFQVNSIYMTKDNSIWVGTDYGMVQLKYQGETLDYTFYYSGSGLNRTQISSKRINGLFEDKEKNLWITTFGGGINYIDLNQKQFFPLSMEDGKNGGLTSNFIRALEEDENGNLWIGTERNGVFHYDFKTGTYTAYVHKDNDNNTILNDAIRSLKIDSKNKLWIGSLQGISILSLASGQMWHLRHDPNDENSLSGNNIFAIEEDRFGNIWAGSWENGVSKIDFDGKNFTVNRFYPGQSKNTPFSLTSPKISYIYTDTKRPEVFVAGTRGINHIYLDKNGDVKEVKHYLGVDGYKKSLTSNFIWPMFRENDSIIWAGTIGGGLNKVTLSNKSPYGYWAEKVAALDDVQFSDIESIEMDKEGILWIGGNGLSRWDKSTGSFANFRYEDGLRSNNFKIGASHTGKSGRMYFAGTEGINYFIPENIHLDTLDRATVLTGFSVNGKKVSIGASINDHVILNSEINSQEHLKLVYGQNDFTINFSSLSYSNPQTNIYRYKLEGYDLDWSETTGALPSATYSNLDYGDYLFKVAAYSGNGSWSTIEKELKITLMPPWWWSNMAKIVYLLFAVTLLYFAYRWFMLKKAYEISVIEKNQKEEINKLRLQFFTNMSHEFRTPLTLIINPLQELLKKELGERKRLRYYNHMLNNSKRMLRLVNELMDFQKIETKAYELNPTKQDIDEVIHDVYEGFLEFALFKDIEFGYEPKVHTQAFWFDRTVVEKILFNILGNAFKYTDKGGKITLQLTNKFSEEDAIQNNSFRIWNQQEDMEYLWVKVTDTGKGISQRDIQFIFDRFFYNKLNKNKETEGSGVGLSLVKSLVTLQRGSIVVSSKEDVGTSFSFSIPYNPQFEQEKVTNNGVGLSKSSLSPVYDQPNLKLSLGENYGKPSILIVEDNRELRHFLKENFEDEFYVMESENGKEALNMMESFKPDLIISDILMPEMDGIELCKKVKENPSLSNIPLVLLTSYQSLEKQLEGAKAKADLYLAKPFSVDVLKVSIHNIIDNRKKLKTSIVEDVFQEAHSLADGTKENDFMKKVTEIIMDNLDNGSFDVNMLAKKLNMSRTKTYNEIKAVSKKTVGELIRDIRLKKAALILASEDISVSQAMYRVGIQSHSYFTKIFKTEYGKTPRQFIKDLNKTPMD